MEITQISTKFQLCYNLYILDCPLILLQKKSDWIDLLGRKLIDLPRSKGIFFVGCNLLLFMNP